MSEQNPPPRRRPTTAGSASVGPARPVRRTVGAAPRIAPRPAPAPLPASDAKLVCTAGPRTGTEFSLTGDDEIVIGRATDNAVSIPDTSVSRKHCSVRRVEDGWAISDLGSGNGTQINGEQLDDEAVLRNGDTITIGDTELVFADVSDATSLAPMPVRVSSGVPARPRPSVSGRAEARARLSRAASAVDPAAQAKKKKLLVAVAGVVVLAVVGLVFLKLQQDKAAEQALAQQMVLEQRKAQLGSVFQDAKNLIREYKWVEAKAKLEEIVEVAPEYPGVKDYLDRARVEIPNQEHLAAAEAALAKNELSTAAQALAKVTSDTQQDEKRSGLKIKLDARVASRLTEANAAMDARQYEQAVAITEDILKARPENRDAQVLIANAKQAIALRDAPRPVAPTVAPKPWLDVITRYIDGDLSGALAMADECAMKASQCRVLARQIRDFAELYKKVEELDATGLSKLLSLDRAITDGKRSKMARTAGTRAANLFFKNASSAKVAGQWGRAMEWAQKALSADPGHAGANAIAEEVSGKAKDQYMLAYSIKDQNPDDAVLKFREVLAMTKPGDEYYEKAQHWIEKIGR